MLRMSLFPFLFHHPFSASRVKVSITELTTNRLLVLTTLLLRVVALFRTKFWEGQKNLISVPKSFGSWNPSGFSVQFSVNLSILPNNPPAGAVQGEQTKASSAAGPSEGAEEGRLIET